MSKVKNDSLDKLAEQCWHGVADAIDWDEYVKDGQPHPETIIKEFLKQVFENGLEEGARNPYA